MADQSLSATLSDGSPESVSAPAPAPAPMADTADTAAPPVAASLTAGESAPAPVEAGAEPVVAAAPTPPLAPYGVSTPLVGAARCPWCSAELPAGTTDRCPTCSANLTPEGDPSIPGVTEVIGQAARALPTEPVRRSSRLLSWISGDIEPDPVSVNVGDDAPPEAFAPPPRDVRREMLRLQLEAEGFVITDDDPTDEAATAGDDAGPEAAADAQPSAADQPMPAAAVVAVDAAPAPSTADVTLPAPAISAAADAPAMPDALVSAQPQPDQAPTQLHG